MDVATELGNISQTLNEIKIELGTKATSAEINNLLEKIEEKETRICTLEIALDEQKVEIDFLKTRLVTLENRAAVSEREFAHNRVISDLNSRLIDDQEQVSRKVNLRIDGLDVTPNESTTSLMAKITSECGKLNLDLIDHDFDRCHRIGPMKTTSSGKSYQSLILKLCSWRARDIIYTNRKKFPFKVNHDLTKKRYGILDQVRVMIDEYESVFKVVSFAFVDRNCKFKFKSINNKFYGFSSTSEFSTLVARIGVEQLMTDQFSLDEQNDELFY
jgi:hypothetical protein